MYAAALGTSKRVVCGQQNLSPGCQSIFRGVPVGRPLTPFSGFPLFETLCRVPCTLASRRVVGRVDRRTEFVLAFLFRKPLRGD